MSDSGLGRDVTWFCTSYQLSNRFNLTMESSGWTILILRVVECTTLSPIVYWSTWSSLKHAYVKHDLISFRDRDNLIVWWFLYIGTVQLLRTVSYANTNQQTTAYEVRTSTGSRKSPVWNSLCVFILSWVVRTLAVLAIVVKLNTKRLLLLLLFWSWHRITN